MNQKENKIMLTSAEVDFIIDSLQQTWLDAVEKLKGNQLGDIERQNYEYARDKSKELMTKLLSITNITLYANERK